MENNNEFKTPTDGAAASRGGFLTWLDNFWYHYKWHSIVALFLVFAICICSFQMCSKEDYDLYVVYAGNKQISRKSENGDISEYASFGMSLKNISSDYDGNGTVSVSLLDLFMLSSAEIAEIEQIKDTEVNYALLTQNNEKFDTIMSYSTYYLCFLSERLYEEYKTVGDVPRFVKLSKYVSDGVDVKYHDESSIYLHGSGLSFAELPSISSLPADTVICLRQLPAFGKSEAKEHFRRGEESLLKILASYTAQEDN